MNKNDIESKSALSELENIPNIYALGATEHLKGEIQIFDGKPFNSFVKNDVLAFDTTFEKNATLIIYTSVTEWSITEITEDINQLKKLEQFIRITAKEQGIDVDKPFPFLLEGIFPSIKWHVINWKEGDLNHTHDKHIASGLSDELINRQATVLGFYSNHHHRIFTHHTTNLHMHFKTEINDVAGHADELIIKSGSMLKLPIDFMNQN